MNRRRVHVWFGGHRAATYVVDAALAARYAARLTRRFGTAVTIESLFLADTPQSTARLHHPTVDGR